MSNVASKLLVSDPGAGSILEEGTRLVAESFGDHSQGSTQRGKHSSKDLSFGKKSPIMDMKHGSKQHKKSSDNLKTNTSLLDLSCFQQSSSQHSQYPASQIH